MKLLVVEDDESILELLTSHLDARGHEVVAARDGKAGLAAFRQQRPDLIVLDIVLPELDGWSVLEAVRKSSDVPVIFLTSLHDAEDVVRGLAMGADDYLRKPFEPRELDARIEAVRRRTGRTADGIVLSAGPIRIDDRSKRVTVHEQEITLTPKELELLKLLASDVGRVFSHEEILARLWRDSPRAGAADVKQYIHLLRGKLGEGGRQLIHTVTRFGYKLVV